MRRVCTILAGCSAILGSPMPAAVPDSILPPVVSPIQYFRDLMAMESDAREQALAGKLPQHRETLMAKVMEYDAMPEAERESRLQRLQLPVYLLPLMQMAPGALSNRLERIPEKDRALVALRLGEWHRLSKEQQREALTNQTALQYFFRPAEAPTVRSAQWLSIWPPQLKAKLENGLRHWQSLSESERQALTAQFRQFFLLDPGGQERVLLQFTESERRSMKTTLDLFARLLDAKRQECLAGFGKFANLSAEQRDLFILNVQRWQGMTPAERNLWRRMVIRLQAPPQLPRLPSSNRAQILPDSNLVTHERAP
jgi:hypothetical protein